MQLHSFKGLSGTIGATCLYGLSQSLESNITQIKCDELNEELRQVRAEIEKTFPKVLSDHTNPSEAASAIKIHECLVILKEALKTKRSKQINPAFHQFKSLTLNQHAIAIVEELQTLISAFAYDEAFSVCLKYT